MVPVCEATGLTSDAIVGISYVLIFVPMMVHVYCAFTYYKGKVKGHITILLSWIAASTKVNHYFHPSPPCCVATCFTCT